MRTAKLALIAATVFATACASDGTSSPNTNTNFETRLNAVAAAPSTTLADPVLNIAVTVSSTLPESVSGNACASAVQARLANGSTWTDVTSTTAVCSTIAVLLPSGGTVSIRGVADPAKVRSLLGGNSGTVVFKVQHSLAGSSTNYLLQSNEVTWNVI